MKCRRARRHLEMSLGPVQRLHYSWGQTLFMITEYNNIDGLKEVVLSLWFPCARVLT